MTQIWQTNNLRCPFIIASTSAGIPRNAGDVAKLRTRSCARPREAGHPTLNRRFEIGIGAGTGSTFGGTVNVSQARTTPAIDFECSQLFRASSSQLTGSRVPQKTRSLASPDAIRTHGRPPAQEYRLRLKRRSPRASHGSPLEISTEFRTLAPPASFQLALCFVSGYGEHCREAP